MTGPRTAMIFAAGFGTRMGTLTRNIPKPMVPLGGRPMIDRTVSHLRNAGVDTIVANAHYLADQIAPYLSSQGVHVIHEHPRILDTGGGLRNALPALGPGPVITINPDACWLGGNPVEFLLQHWRDEMQSLLLLVPSATALGTNSTGDFSLEHGHIRRTGSFIYGGAQVIRTDRLNEIDQEVFSLNAYWDLLLKAGPLHGVTYDDGWCDIGTPQGLAIAEEALRGV